MFTIGELSSQTGANIETIRYYERIGLMPRPARSPGGRRQYSGTEAQRLGFIRRARELGFGIEPIRTLLDLAEPGHRSCDEVRSIAATHLGNVRAKIDDLARLEAILSDTVSRCEVHASAPACPVLEMLETAP